MHVEVSLESAHKRKDKNINNKDKTYNIMLTPDTQHIHAKPWKIIASYHHRTIFQYVNMYKILNHAKNAICM